ncbi:MAG: response regulator transcription factor [Chitinophagaceae bacterium]|nr:response regulator transcription factor [Chitinophagaceae bacterium]
MEKITIMIIDDHTLIRETWSFLLGKNEGFEVVAETGDGEKAIGIAKELRPNIVLLDINMTPLNGFDVLKLLRKYSPGSKVIAVSMHSQPTYAKKMLRMGARGYVTKNSPRQEMMDAVVDVHKGNIYICDEVKNILSHQLMNEEEEPSGLNHLSEREIEVINLLKDGQSSKEIAGSLSISYKTVEVHRHNILKKLKVKNTASLINFINGEGL